MDAYADRREHLRDELRRLDLLLWRYLAAWRADRGGADEGGGLYVSDAKVDRLLRSDPLVGGDASGGDRSPTADGSGTTTGAGPTRAAGRQVRGDAVAGPDGADLDDRLRTLTERVRERERETLAAGGELPLVSLADRFGLGRRHVDLLLVALAPELDLKYETVYAYLQDDLTRKRPTAGTALRVVGGTVGSETDERALLTPGSPLLEGRLVRLAGNEGAVLSRPVEVDRRIVGFLLGEDDPDPALDGIAELVDPDAALPDLTAPDAAPGASPIDRLPVAPSTRDRLATLRGSLGDEPPAMVHCHGPSGSGRAAAVAALAAETGSPLVAVDTDRILAEEAGETLELLRREARLRDGAIHVRNVAPAEDGHTPGPASLIASLESFAGPVFLSGEATVPPRLGATVEEHTFATVTFERPSFDRCRSLWAQAGLPIEPAEFASKFPFTPGEIEDVAATARTLAAGKPGTEDVSEACRALSRERLGDLARGIEPTYGWDDIVLPDTELRQLREVAAHVEHQGTVFSEWGFEEHFSLGTGVNVLFAGPSGTGKTMAAEILANETGLDLYKVDLASVVSKYIGETESNLGRVFDEAETSNAIIFFDEADALFGERSEVSDAHDRYANVEVDYLLERMEEHDGVVVLATNLEENVDDAFRRRINVSVEFPLPDREAREEIWRGVFPGPAPVGELDWAFLAGFDLTGGDIRNAALTAAFLSADDENGRTIGMEHAVRGLWRELQKGGRLVSRDDFGEYAHYVRC